MLLWMLVWIRFWGSFGGLSGVKLGSTWGPFGVHLGSQERLHLKTPFQHLFDSISDPSWTPSWPQLGGLWASWGGLGPLYFPSSFQCFVKPYFESISDPKRPQNQSKFYQKSMPKSRSEKGLISIALRFNFEENLMLMPKEAIFKNHARP